jgi:hypothetical protein
MLELRPNCEGCDVDLPATSADARIYSYECTFCAGQKHPSDGQVVGRQV